jgi:hypothetical protein
MWIVPRQLSHFAPGSEGLNLESTELAWIFSQSVTWRTKHFAKQTWLKRWKREKWLQHLFGRTLKPSIHSRFVEWWTGSLVATLASHFPQREKEKARKTQDTCGPIFENTSEQLTLDGFLPKMSKDTYRLDSPQSSQIWKKMVTKRRSEYLVRRKLARHTNENESTSLQNFPTPIVGEEKFRIKGNSHASICLSAMARRGELTWATPNTMDYMELRSDEGVKKLATGARKGRKRPSNLREQVDERTCQIYKEQNWPTPRTGGGSRPNQKGGKILNEEVQIEEGLRERGKKLQKNWATPQASDHVEGARTAIESNQKCLGRDLNQLDGPQDPDKNNTTGKSQGSYRLNPNFVEQMMGLKVGWTQLSTEWIDSDCLVMG